MSEGTDTSKNNSGSNTDAAAITDPNKGRKFEFDADEQTFIQGIIDKSVGKVHGQYKSQIEDLTKQLEELKSKSTEKPPKKDGEGEDDAKDKQYKTLLDNEKAKTKNAELVAQQREKELKEAQAEAMRIRKEVAIQKAAAKQNFYELDVVTKMTWDTIEYDDDLKSFVIKENGIVKQNSSLQPMTLDEYYTNFAAQRPYLVNGDMVSGTGSAESKSTSLGVVKSKADLKTAKEKSDFISKFGFDKFESLPLK